MFRHSEITGAHKDAVMSVVMAADCIYTASRDKTLKRRSEIGFGDGDGDERKHEKTDAHTHR